MSPAEFLINRFDAIESFEKLFHHSTVPPATARAWYRSGNHERFFNVQGGEHILWGCQMLEKIVPLDDIYWTVGRGSVV